MRQLIFLIFSLIAEISTLQEQFIAQQCTSSTGPSHGEVLRYDPNQFNDTFIVYGETLDCWLTLKGQPDSPGRPKRQVTLQWRNDNRNPFSVRGYQVAGGGDPCATAYVEIYNATSQGRYIPPAISRTCGTTVPPTFTTISNVIVVHLFVAAAPTPAPPASTAAAVTNANTAAPVVQQTQAATAGTAAAVVPVTVPAVGVVDNSGPYINFTADFTSYFVGTCDLDGVLNNGEQLWCFTNRCIDRSLRCDQYLANNCGDLGDNSPDLPGNCTWYREQQRRAREPNLLPLWIVLGILGGLLLLWWFGLCHTCCCPCKGCGCCGKGGCCGPHGQCMRCCGGNSCSRECMKMPCCRGCECCNPSRDPADPFVYDKGALAKMADSGSAGTSDGGSTGCMPCCRGGGSTGVATGSWLNFAFDDGCHVREGR